MIKKILAVCFLCAFVVLAHADEIIATIPSVSLRQTKNLALKSEIYKSEISPQEIQQSPTVSLQELLQQEQSTARLTNNSGDSSQTAISIRGFGDNAAANSLILIDGFPFVNASALAPNLNLLALFDIERIDILQGSQGSLWGDQAVGGIVNIITKHPKNFSVETIAATGSFNKLFLGASISNKLPTGFFFKTFALTNSTDNFRAHQKQKNADILLQFGLDYLRGTINLKLQQSENDVQFPGGLTYSQFQRNPRQATQLKNAAHYRNNLLQIFNKHFFNDAVWLETYIGHYAIDGNGFVYFNYNRNEIINSFHTRLHSQFNHNKYIVGYYLQQSDYQFDNLNIQERANALQQNLYAQIQHEINHKINLTLGARFATQRNEIAAASDFNNNVFVTEQGLSFLLNDNLKFYIRRDGNFRFPKANEVTWLAANQNRLQAQTGTSYEAGTIWQLNSHQIETNIYRLELNNEIAFNPNQTAEQPFGSFQNFKKTLRNGISITDNWHYSEDLKIQLQANLVDARFASGIDNGKQIPAVPNMNALGSLQYQLTPNWRTKYIAIYNGSQYASEDNANVGRKLPGYWLHTISLQYIKPNFNLAFEIANLFNQTYAAYSLYNANTNSIIYYPGTGRSLLLTLKLNI